MQALSRAPKDPECSVGLTLNAKGDVQIAVEAKGDADRIEAVGARVQAEFERLCDAFPRPEPTDADTRAREAAKVAGIQAARAKKAGAS